MMRIETENGFIEPGNGAGITILEKHGTQTIIEKAS